MLKEYRQHLLARGRSLGTIAIRTRHIERLLQRHPDVQTITTSDLEAELAARRFTHSAEARKSMRGSYRVFFRWARRTGLIAIDPADELEPIRVPVRRPRVAADDVVQMGLLTADEQMTAMILLARFGCLRLTELTTLHMRQRQHDTLRIIGKGDKERIVPVNDDLMHALLVLERQAGGPTWYFPGRFGGSLHPQSVNKMMTRHLGINPHSLRHAGATAAYRETGDVEAVRELLGHSSIATTQRYLHVGFDAVRRAAAATAFRAPITRFPSTTLPMQEPSHGGQWAA